MGTVSRARSTCVAVFENQARDAAVESESLLESELKDGYPTVAGRDSQVWLSREKSTGEGERERSGRIVRQALKSPSLACA